MTARNVARSDRQPAAAQEPSVAWQSIALALLVVSSVLYIALLAWWPVDVYAEFSLNYYAMSQFVLALAGAGIVVADATQGELKRVGWLAGVAGLFYLWLLVSTRTGPFPFTGTEGLFVLYNVGVLSIAGYALARASRRQFPQLMTIAAMVFVAFVCYDSLDQVYHRFPAALSELYRDMNAGYAMNPMTAELIHAFETGRASSRWGNPNLLAAGLAMALPFLAIGSIEAKRAPMRWAAILLGGVALPMTLLLTGSRGGILTALGSAALTAGTAWFVYRDRIDKPFVLRWAGALAVGVILWAVVGATRPDLTGGKATSLEEAGFARPQTVSMRMGFLRAGAIMAQDAGLKGHGVGSYEYLFHRVQRPDDQESQYAHCWPLQLLVEGGWGGLAMALVVLGLAALAVATGDQRALACVVALPAVVWLSNGAIEMSSHRLALAAPAALCAGFAVGLGARRTEATEDDTFHRALLAGAVVGGWFLMSMPLRPHLRLDMIESYLRGGAPVFRRDEPTREEYVEMALGLFPDDPGMLQTKAVMVAARGQFHAATMLYERALAANPHSATTRLALADLLARTEGDHERAKLLLGELKQVAPASKKLWRQAAAIWSKLDDEEGWNDAKQRAGD